MKCLRLMIVFSIAALMAVTAYADDLTVTDYMEVTGHIDGNVIIASGGRARMYDAKIKGDVIVEPGGALDSYGGNTIKGSVRAEGATFFWLGFWVYGPDHVWGDVHVKSSRTIVIRGSVVGGDVRIEENDNCWVCDILNSTVAGRVQIRNNDNGNPSHGNFYVWKTTVGDDVLIEKNNNCYVDVWNNMMCGDLQAFENNSDWSLYIWDNTVGGDLKCGGNSPTPDLRDNVVAGDIQCDW